MHNDTGVQGKALYFASKGVDPDWVELLLEQDAALDFIDGDGKTGLDVASYHTNTRIRTNKYIHTQTHSY